MWCVLGQLTDSVVIGEVWEYLCMNLQCSSCSSDYTQRDECVQIGIQSIPSNWINLEFLGGVVKYIEQSSSQKARTALEQLHDITFLPHFIFHL